MVRVCVVYVVGGLRQMYLEKGEAKHLEAINGAMKEGTRMELTEEVDK